MRTCADSVNVDSLPAGLPLYGAYVNGNYANYAAVKARFPLATIIGISVFNQNVGDCLDVERYDADPSEAPGWVASMRANGHPGPLVYCSESVWPECQSQFRSQGVPPPSYWIAGYPGSAGAGNLYPGSVGHQFTDHGPWDESVFVDYLPGIDPTTDPPVPPPKPIEEMQMLARNTAGRGYWAARHSGAVYAYDGAPYLGPTPAFLTQWGIGTLGNPVVGICDDGHGGYVLEADNDQYPGQPALYHIDSSGQFAK